MVAQRIAREYVAQVVAFAVALADRILLAGLMVRAWGTDGFAGWSVAMAAAGMVALFDFGLANYFANRLLISVQTGANGDARHVLRAGNLLMLLASAAGVAIVLIGWLILHKPVGGIDSGTTLLLVVLAIVAALAVRQGMAVQIAVYRAYEQFDRQTRIVALADICRIFALAVALLAGNGVLMTALVYLAATLLFLVIPCLVDTARRFPAFRYGTDWPDPADRGDIAAKSGQYWVQSSVSTLITYAPLLMLGMIGAVGVAIVQFTLIRTLANFSRSVLQLFANVFGLEVSRRLAIADEAGAASNYRESTRFLAVQTAAATGALAAIAVPLFALWTGGTTPFHPLLFWLALGPPLIIPSLSLATQVLTTANMPKPLMQGRLAQLALTALAFAVLPMTDSAVRMMAALAIGEVVGLGAPVTVALARRIDGIGLLFHVDLMLRSVLAGATAFALAWLGSRLGGAAGLVAGGVCGGVGIAAATLVLGVSPSRRQQLTDALSARLRSGK